MAYLALVRHGLSEYNKKGLWTGRMNPDLAPEGVEDAQKVAVVLSGIRFDYAFSSEQLRHTHTLEIILQGLSQKGIPTERTDALNERDYGVYTGKNKWEVKKELGDEEFKRLRRSWDYPIPQGESLKDVGDRVTIFYKQTIYPLLAKGDNVIISSSGNVLRSLVKFLENIPDEKISELEIAPGEVYLYKLEDGEIVSKEVKNQKKNVY